MKKSLDSIEEVDFDYDEFEWGEFMRIKVNLNITKPLLSKETEH